MKKFIWFMIIGAVILLALPLTSQAAPLMKLSWRVEYYDNDSLSGAPKLSRFEDVLSHDWGNGSPSPELPNDRFSARWTGTRHLEKGTYLFLLTVDDGARVWFDGELLIDAWSIGRKDKLQAEVYLEQSGDHEIQVAYFEKTGKALITFEWFQLGGPDDIVGAWRGEYFVNKDLAGTPALVRQDGAINFDWNSEAPDPKITRDNFSVRWTRSSYFRTGSYELTIQHDDGMRIFVDGKSVYDSWRDQTVTYQTRTVRLTDGLHTFVVEYYDHVGNAVAYVSIEQTSDDGGAPSTIVVVDNKGPGFWWGGPMSSRYEAGGYCYGPSFYWTFNSHSHPVNYGVWTPWLKGAGDYEVFVFIPGHHATTTAARYRIQHNGERHDRVINQGRYANNWVSLGTYYFNSGGNESVILYDNTGEAEGTTQIAFDAVKFVKR